MNTNNKLVQQNYSRSKGGVGPEFSLYQKIQKQKIIPQNVINNYQQKKDLMSPRSDRNQNQSDVKASEMTAEHGIASIEPANKIRNLDQRSVKNKNQIDQKFVRHLHTKQIIKNSFAGNNNYLAFKNQLSDSIKTDKNNATVDRDSHAADFSMTDTTGFQQIQHSTMKTHTKHTKTKALYRSPNDLNRKLMSGNNLHQKLNSTNQVHNKKSRLTRMNSHGGLAHNKLESMNLLNNLTKAKQPERDNSRSSDNIPVEKFDKTARKLRQVGKQESRVTLDQMNQKTPYTSRKSPKGIQQQKEELQVDPEAESLQKTKVKTVAHNQKTHRISQLLEEQSDKQFQHAIPSQLISKKTNQKDKQQKSIQEPETFMGFKINLLNEASNHKLRLPKKLVNKTMSSDAPEQMTDPKNVQIQRLNLNPGKNFPLEDNRLKTVRDDASSSKRAQRSLFESAKQELRKIQNFKKESQYIEQKNFLESPTIQPLGINSVNQMSTNLRTKHQQPSDKQNKQVKVDDFNPYQQQRSSDKKSNVRMRSQELRSSNIKEVFDNNYENFSADDEEHSFVGVVADDQAVAQISGQVGEFGSMTKMRPKKSPRKTRQIRNSIPKIQDSFHKISLKHSFDGSSVKDRSRCMSSSNMSDHNDNPRGSNLSSHKNTDSQPRLSNTSYNSAQRDNLRLKKKGKTVLEYSQMMSKMDQKHQSAVQVLGHDSIRTSAGFERQQSEILNEDGISQKMGEITTRGLGTTKKEQKKAAIETCIPEKKLNLRFQNLRQLQSRNFNNGQSLTHIDVRNNRLQQLPDQLCDCTFLRELRLDYNFLQTLPNGINQLQNMTLLSASQNNLKVIPYNLLSLKGNLSQLILNDNKIQQIQSKIGNLINLKQLLLHNNQIVDIPSSMYKLKNLKQLSLDWFAYLYSEQITLQTKLLKGFEVGEKYKDGDEIEEAHKHQQVINDLLDLCKIVQIVELKKYFEETQQIFHENPQQDDCEPKQQNHLMTRGVTKKKKVAADNHDPLNNQKSVRIQFIKFLLFFNGLTYIDQLIMKSIHPNKQRRLSHLIALQGNLYLLKDILKQIDIYHHNCLCQNSAFGQDLLNISSQNALRILQTKYQFLNSIDRDFSTPIILALKNKKNLIVKELMDHPKTCLKQSSMKYGTALHVSLGNDEFKLSYKILRMLKAQKDFNPEQDFNKIDEDGNSLLHILFRNFNQDVENASKISLNLIKRGCNLKYKNKIKHTPLHQAYYYLQNDAIKFALYHNQQIRRQKYEQKHPMFDFNGQGGKLNFTSLHYAVYQNNFQLLFMLLRSREYLDHTIKDSAGRRAIDLCNSISAVFKALRRELQKQRTRVVRINVQTTEEQEAKFQPVHKILLNKMKLTHYHINKLEIRRKNEGLKRTNSNNQTSFATRHQSVKPSIQQSYFTTIDSKHSMPRQSEKYTSKGKKIYDTINEDSALTPMTLPGAFSKRVSTNQQLESKRKLYYQKSEHMIKKASINIAESVHKTQLNKQQQERAHNTSINSINQIQESRAFSKRMSQNSNYFPASAKPTGTSNNFIKKKRSVEVLNDINNLTYDQSFKYQQDLDKSNSQAVIDLKSVNQIMAEQSTHDGPPSRSGFQYPHSRQHGIDNQFRNIELSLENMDDESGSDQGVFYPLEDSDSSLSDAAGAANSNRDSKRYNSDLHGENVSDDDANEQAYGQSPQTGQRASLKAFSSQFESSKLFQKNSFNEQKVQGKPNGVDMLMRAESHIGYHAPEFQMQDFQDSEQLVKYLLKIHQIQQKSNELYLLERINDSLDGKIFPQHSMSVKPPVALDQKAAKLQDSNICDDLELSDEDHTPTLLSNRKNIGGTTMIQKSFQEIDKNQTKKQNNKMAVADYEENSIGVEEIDMDSSVNNIGARKQSTTSQLSLNTFGKKRQSYLNHEENGYARGKNMSQISNMIIRSNQTSRNQLRGERTNTITSYRSDMSFNSDADQQVQNPNVSKNANQITQRSMNMIIIDESQQNPIGASNKQSTVSSVMFNQQQQTILKKIEVFLIEFRNTHDLTNQMRIEFRICLDQLNTEVHKITQKKDLQDYLKQLQSLIINVKRMEHPFFKTICMELDNVAGVVNLKVQRPEKKSIITTKKPSLSNFNQIKKLDLSKITNLKDQIFQNNTQRLTMQKRPQLLQTNKPAQGSAYKAIGDDNKSVETLAITKVKSVKDFDEELTNKINKFIDESKVNDSYQQNRKEKKADSYVTSSNVTIKDSRIHTAQKDNALKRTRSSKKEVNMSQTQSMQKIMKTIQNANINRLKKN